MEILRVGFYGLVTPFHSGREEPGEGENNPPDGAGHAEEVEHHKQHRAAFLLRALRDQRLHLLFGEVGLGRLEGLHARYLLPHEEPHDIGQRHHEVTPRQEDDGALRVPEPGHVDQEGQDREQRGGQAQEGPDTDPPAGELSLPGVEEEVVAGRPAVLLRVVAYPDPVVKPSRSLQRGRADKAEIIGRVFVHGDQLV